MSKVSKSPGHPGGGHTDMPSGRHQLPVTKQAPARQPGQKSQGNGQKPQRGS